MALSESVWFATIAALFLADGVWGRWRLFPYLASFLVAGLVISMQPVGDFSRIDTVARAVPVLGLVYVLERQTGESLAGRLVAVGAVTAAFFIPLTFRSVYAFPACVNAAAAAVVLARYWEIAAVGWPTPRAADHTLVLFAALDGTTAGALALEVQEISNPRWVEVNTLGIAAMLYLSAAHFVLRGRQ
ncbi:MAG: hypothetical protein AAF447_17320 [Myxococcota bacterium]